MSESEPSGKPPQKAPESAPGKTPQFVARHSPESMDSLDARLIQYRYAITKLQSVVAALGKLVDKQGSSEANTVILIHYLVYTVSSLFAINESGYSPKLLALERYEVPKSLGVNVSAVVTHVAYDVKDQNVNILDELPDPKTSVVCLKALKALCSNCLEAYQKRYTNASREINNPDYVADLETMFNGILFKLESDFDLTLKSSVLPLSPFELTVDPALLTEAQYREATLIDIDLQSLFTIAYETTATLNHHRALVFKFRAIKQTPTATHGTQLKTLPHHQYALHRILFWTLRVNDLYFMLRKFVRQVYISNHSHLHDQKFKSFLKNSLYFMNLSREIEDHFLATKKNGVLIATITRFIRMTTKQTINPKITLEFIGFIHQSVVYIESVVQKLQEFARLWISAELGFREAHDLATDALSKINDAVQAEYAREIRAKQAKQQAEKAKVEAEKASKSSSQRQSIASKPQRTATTQGPNRPSKSPSASNSPVPRVTQDPKPDSRAGSLTSGSSKPPATPYLHRNTSSSSLQTSSTDPGSQEKQEALATTQGRRRSNSQPISFNTAAAAAALKSSKQEPVRSPTSAQSPTSLRSPTGSIKRTNSTTRRVKSSASPSSFESSSSQRERAEITSPLSTKVTKLELVAEQPPQQETPRLTVSQRFQQHLMEASKSGALVGKEKEVFKRAVFDPNNPSAFSLKAHQKPQQKPATSIELDQEQTPPVETTTQQTELVTPRPTRAQITRLNTRRNSVSIRRDSTDPSVSSLNSASPPISASSESSFTNELSIKKVRFTGVPEYTPAEDAPSSQSSRILKNFAALKLTHNKLSPFKQKDQLLKKEESMSFITVNEASETTVPGNPPTHTFSMSASQSPSKFARFRSRF